MATIKGDRVISSSARMKLEDELMPFKGMQFDLLVFRDSESIAFMSSLREILISPKVGWVQIPSTDKFSIPNLNPRVGLTLFSGVEIATDKSRTEWRPAAAAIVRILKEDGIAAEGVNAVSPKNVMHIIVGAKPRMR